MRDDEPQFQILPFTNSIDDFENFVGEVVAYGGGDFHENVLGGMEKALELKWTRVSKLIIHILDAPPHGHMFGMYYQDDDQEMKKYNYMKPGVKILPA